MQMEYRHGDEPAPIEQLYTNQTQPYFRAPQIYISTAARFMLGRRVLVFPHNWTSRGLAGQPFLPADDKARSLYVLDVKSGAVQVIRFPDALADVAVGGDTTVAACWDGRSSWSITMTTAGRRSFIVVTSSYSGFPTILRRVISSASLVCPATPWKSRSAWWAGSAIPSRRRADAVAFP